MLYKAAVVFFLFFIIPTAESSSMRLPQKLVHWLTASRSFIQSQVT